MRMLELNTEKKLLSQNVLTTSNEDQGTGMTAKVEKLRYMMENYWIILAFHNHIKI